MIHDDECDPMDERIGGPDLPGIWQGARPHGPTPVGLASADDPNARHALVGCAAVALTMAARRLVRPDETVMAVAAHARALGRAVYPLSHNPAAAIIPELVRAQPGLRVGVDFPGAGAKSLPPVADLRPLILAALRNKGCALVCVDFDSMLKHGDPTGEHWCNAYAAERGHLYLDDPATAKAESVQLDTLSASVMWGRVDRPYRVARVVTVFRA